ncbi:hypothetical protein E2C01_039506 [Portunus trituberculatus]|uniref:Uncharacterized protein n=1 Tax=Portunus trituberculatus TaxID=210409 RepID=A0A5B7FEX1_PORTR|nr:hypothetical protein [Portunus trituberculatus]
MNFVRFKPVYYGSYSSFCPTYDSTFANLSKDESEMRWCSQQAQSNLIATLSPSLQAFMEAILRQEVALTLLKNLGSSYRSTRNRGGEPANHSKAAAFGPSPSKFKPRKFAKMDVVVRYADFLV